MAKNYEQVGFIPKAGIERLSSQNGLAVGILNGEPCGYILYQPPKPYVDARWLQVAIPSDLQRMYFGAQLVTYAEQKAITANALGIKFKVACDIDANTFWQQLGYYCTGNIMGGIKRSRMLNSYRKDFHPTLLKIVKAPFSGQSDLTKYNKYRRTKNPAYKFGWRMAI